MRYVLGAVLLAAIGSPAMAEEGRYKLIILERGQAGFIDTVSLRKNGETINAWIVMAATKDKGPYATMKLNVEVRCDQRMMRDIYISSTDFAGRCCQSNRNLSPIDAAVS